MILLVACGWSGGAVTGRRVRLTAGATSFGSKLTGPLRPWRRSKGITSSAVAPGWIPTSGGSASCNGDSATTSMIGVAVTGISISLGALAAAASAATFSRRPRSSSIALALAAASPRVFSAAAFPAMQAAMSCSLSAGAPVACCAANCVSASSFSAAATATRAASTCSVRCFAIPPIRSASALANSAA